MVFLVCGFCRLGGWVSFCCSCDCCGYVALVVGLDACGVTVCCLFVGCYFGFVWRF